METTPSLESQSHFIDHPRAPRVGEELISERLESYLRRHLEDPTGEFKIQQFPSGHSNLTYFIQLGGRELVLRRAPYGAHVATAHDMGREYRVLSKLYRVYPQAPMPYFFCEDPSIIGAPFYIMKRIKGVILRRDPPLGLLTTEAEARGLSQAFVGGLAALHEVDFQAAGLSDLGKPAGFAERQVKGWSKRYFDSKTEELPEAERVIAWMAEQVPTRSPAALVHNDYKYDNLILDPQDLTRIIGLLDWEMCTLGDPLMDLGTSLAYWVEAGDPEELEEFRWGPTEVPGSYTRRELVEAYAKLTGAEMGQIRFYYAFGLFKVGVILQQIYARYVKGLTPDERFARLGRAAQAYIRQAYRAIESGAL